MFRSTHPATKAAAVKLALSTVALFVAVPVGARRPDVAA
jgi:hypothetical protein